MLTRSLFAWCAAVAAMTVVLCGCGRTEDKKPAAEKPKPAADQPAARVPADANIPDATDTKGLAELSPEDRAAAEKQRICPVSGELLGSMGKPYKIRVKDRDVFLCCAGCEESIKADPDTYLAKLPK